MRPAIVVGLMAPLILMVAAHGVVRRPATSGLASRDPRAAIFVQRGCSECHAIAALGVRATTDVGPDLTFAYADVGNRYAVDLRSFLDNPTGVMGLVLVSHVHLTQADRDSIARTLERLYGERRADMDADVPSFPPVRRIKP
jgi:mono/diheme cytochrome c family protein